MPGARKKRIEYHPSLAALRQTAQIGRWGDRPSIFRIETVFALLIAAPTLCIFPARAKDEFHYDPATCNADAHGHLYIALGRYVLAVPFLKKGLYFLNSVLPNDRRLAPDPTEPEGCPDNPSQQRSFGFYFGSPLVDAGGDSATPMQREAPTRLTLYEVWNPDRMADRDHSEWFGESTIALLTNTSCARATIREVLPNGLTACRIKPVAEARIEDWAVSFISDPGIYATPLGRPFMIDCDPDLYSGPSITKCKVGYSIAPGLALGYEFQPYRGKSAVPFDHVIALDRSIRRQIDAAIVKDFIWPKQENHDGGATRDKP